MKSITKQLSRTLLLPAILAATTGLASATMITDTNNYVVTTGPNQTPNGQIITSTASHTGSFNLLDHGYNFNTQEVTSATATFYLWDSADNEQVRIQLGSETNWATHNSFSGNITLGGGVIGTILGTLDTTGMLSYTLTETQGSHPQQGPRSYYLQSATLVAIAGVRPPPSNVPDGGMTLVLFGMSLGAVAGIRRKFGK